jgi:ATP-dependent Lhr-like helicase
MTPAWAGGTMAVSPTLAAHLRTVIATADDAGPAAAVLDAQAATSHRPSENELLAEILDRDGTRHIFIHTFAGKHEHEGIAALIALRIQRLYPSSISVRVNDYGMLLESSLDLPVDSVLGPHLLSDEGLDEDLEAAVNMDALSRRAFRGIARVCGLVGGGVAAQRPSHRQLQTSSDLLFDVFSKHEPDNLLIAEARREVRETRLDTPQLRTTLHRLRGCRWRVVALHRPSPFAFPLMIEQLNQQTSTLDPEERAARLRAAYGIG